MIKYLIFPFNQENTLISEKTSLYLTTNQSHDLWSRPFPCSEFVNVTPVSAP